MQPPRVNLRRFHGVFAPNSRYRSRVIPGQRGRVGELQLPEEEPTAAERRIIAYIEDPDVIAKILAHLDATSVSRQPICKVLASIRLAVSCSAPINRKE